MSQKITYTTTNVDMSAFHASFDEGLAKVKAEQGAVHPLYIGGEPVLVDDNLIIDTTPIDQTVIGSFQAAKPEQIDHAIAVAKIAQKAWRKVEWTERVAILRKAAELIRERKYFLSALMSYEVGKNRLEAIGDTEESADLIDYYCDQMVEHTGYIKKMNSITEVETNTDVLRPYGGVACFSADRKSEYCQAYISDDHLC